jgi:DmsE family decaheme c-type cytochrome
MRRRFLAGSALALSAFVLFFAGGSLFSTFAPSEANAASMSEACADCHEVLAPAFNQTYHGRAWAGMNSDSSCQSCHGSTDKHLNDPSKETIISFSKSGGKSVAELNKQCLDCHVSSSMLSFWEVGSHNRNDVACASCHTIHSSQSSVDQLTVCFTCHRSKRGQISKISHHPIEEGKVQCSDCHNPHGAESAHGMIKAENVNQLCYKCHADKRGPFVYEHPPVEENCTICHAPHGSRHAKLLTEKVPNLCQDCHDWSRHPGTPYDAKTGFTGSSPSNRFFGRSCLNCHGAIHGSTSFENHAFTR